MINEDKIVSAVSNLPLHGDDNGLIPAFGVYLTKIYGNYYNRVCYEFEREFNKTTDDIELRNASKFLLIEAGHVCAFNTFGGIMTSPEWDAVVLPMIEKKEDWVYGMVAVINALGWGIWRIKELVPENKLVINIENSFESDYYISKYGSNATTSKCYLGIGATAGLMNLIYYGNIESHPTLDEKFYEQLFHTNSGFKAEEILCRSKGDSLCELVATKI